MWEHPIISTNVVVKRLKGYAVISFDIFLGGYEDTQGDCVAH